MITRDFFWYILCTRTGREESVSEKLITKGVEHFIPVSRMRDEEPMPLFPNYVFVNTDQEELMGLTSVKGVVNPLYWRGELAVIPDAEIKSLMGFIRSHGSMRAERIGVMRPDGGIVSVGSVGVLMLPSIGYKLTAYGVRRRTGEDLSGGGQARRSGLAG